MAWPKLPIAVSVSIFPIAVSVHSLSPCLTAGIHYTSFVCLFVCLTTFKGIL